jgi:hypothetical protein
MNVWRSYRLRPGGVGLPGDCVTAWLAVSIGRKAPTPDLMMSRR